jgi:hypothetical protein
MAAKKEVFKGVIFPIPVYPVTQKDFCNSNRTCGGLKCEDCGYHVSNFKFFRAWRGQRIAAGLEPGYPPEKS